ncbi:hypothetical protein AMECASPLE_034804 [Ameca splendens]|uniref:Uncharacterized protein n=1 Tax=Ameca splendens TaxID=208324 RepID=A0ABV0Y724_9TELE
MVPLRPIYVDFLLIRAEMSILIFIFCPNLNRNLQNPTCFCSEENKKLMKSLVLIQYCCKHKLDPRLPGQPQVQTVSSLNPKIRVHGAKICLLSSPQQVPGFL